jgi:1-phosphofructokinase family hexose kinase
MLGGYGIPSVAAGFLGKKNPDLFEELFAVRGVRDEFIRIDGETRIGIKIVARATRETTDINFPGLAPSEAALAALEETLRSLANPGSWFVLGGRLPDSVSPAYYENLLRMLKREGANIAVDTSGEALRLAIECGVDAVKPNHHELAEILGRELPDFASRADAAIRLQRERVPHVILSLGAEGALFVSPDGAFIAAPPPVEVVSTVGAGDSLLAGYLAGLATGLAAAERAKLATVFSWSALEDVRRHAPSPAEALARMARIEVRPLLE